MEAFNICKTLFGRTSMAASARELVYEIFGKRFPGTMINDNTKLANMGIDDGITKQEICSLINGENWRDLKLPMGALSGCSTIKDITTVVENAAGEG